MYCNEADSDADAMTMMEYSSAPNFRGWTQAGDGRSLLADRHVNANEVLTLLIDDRVEADGGLSGLPVADDHSRCPRRSDHRIDRLDAGLHGAIDVAALDHAGRDALDVAELARDDRPFAVQRRPADRPHGPAAHRPRDGRNALGAAHQLSFFNIGVLAQNDHPTRSSSS